MPKATAQASAMGITPRVTLATGSIGSPAWDLSRVLRGNGIDRSVLGRVRVVVAFVSGNPVGKAQRQPDIVPAVQKAFTAKRIEIEGETQAGIVGNGARFEVRRQPVALALTGAPEKLANLSVRQRHGKQAVLEEDVGVAGRNDDAEAVVEDGPRGVLAARPTSEVGARHKNRRALVARLVQHELGIGFLAFEVAPVVEQKLAVSLARQQLQELLGHHLVGVYVDAVDRRDESSVF